MKSLNLQYKTNATKQTNNLVRNFSGTCLPKAMITSDMVDFIKAISCSETIHVSTKQILVAIFTGF